MTLGGIDPVELDRWIEREPEDCGEGCCPDCGAALDDDGGYCRSCAAYDDHIDNLIDEEKEGR